MLAEHKLTSERAVEIAQIAEQVSADVDIMKRSNVVINDVNMVNICNVSRYNKNRNGEQNIGSRKLCVKCNTAHAYGRCRTFNAFCNRCGQRAKFIRGSLCKANTVKVILNALEPHNDTFDTEASVNQFHHFHIDDILRLKTESPISNEVDTQDLVVTIGSFAN